jgi:hypothetical protein
MSSTVIHSKQFVRAVTTNSPARISEQNFAGFWQQWWWLFVKGFHMIEFAILTILLLRATSGSLLIAGGLGVIMALADEYHQTFVPARGGHLSDVAIDSIGILIALLVWQLWNRRRGKSRPTEPARS